MHALDGPNLLQCACHDADDGLYDKHNSGDENPSATGGSLSEYASLRRLLLRHGENGVQQLQIHGRLKQGESIRNDAQPHCESGMLQLREHEQPP